MLEHLLVGKSPDGCKTVFDDRDNFLAAFTGSEWVIGRYFQDYDLEEKFNLVQDDAEALLILAEAREALNKPLVSDQQVKSA